MTINRILRALAPGAARLMMAGVFAAGSMCAGTLILGVNSCPATGPISQGGFVITAGIGAFCGPMENGGLSSWAVPDTITFTSQGFLFDAQSIEVGGVNSAVPPELVTFTGDVYGGGTVTQSYTTAGDSIALQQVTLSGFDNLTNLKVSLNAETLQSFTFQAAPEPATVVLALAGLLGVLVGRGCKHRART
jgi:hypothetical protein